MMEWLQRLFVRESALKDGNDPNYWSNRAKKYGKLAVINLSHGQDNFDSVTKRDEENIFPILKSLLNGREKTVLDFGCGPGRFTADLAGLIRGKAIGVDPTAELLKKAPKHKDTEFRLLKDGRIPVPDRSVDIVWTYNVLGCVKEESMAQTASEIERVLMDGGLLIATENTTEREDVPCFHYRQPDFYAARFPRIALKHLKDFTDKGPGFEERLSIMAGRKK